MLIVEVKRLAGIEKIGRIVADVGELESGDGTIVARLQDAVVLEGQGGRLALRQHGGERNTHARILGDALARKRLAGGVFHLADVQGVVQLEDGGIHVVERGELYARAGAEVVLFRRELGVDDVVVDAHALPLLRQNRQAQDRQHRSREYQLRDSPADCGCH